jgi:hypothetical protein
MRPYEVECWRSYRRPRRRRVTHFATGSPPWLPIRENQIHPRSDECPALTRWPQAGAAILTRSEPTENAYRSFVSRGPNSSLKKSGWHVPRLPWACFPGIHMPTASVGHATESSALQRAGKNCPRGHKDNHLTNAVQCRFFREKDGKNRLCFCPRSHALRGNALVPTLCVGRTTRSVGTGPFPRGAWERGIAKGSRATTIRRTDSTAADATCCGRRPTSARRPAPTISTALHKP